MPTIDQLISLGADLSRMKDRAFNLWTWLPSCDAAKRNHGDYYSEFIPTMDNIMHEACEVIFAMKNGQELPAGDCPCDEPHEV